MLKLTLRAICYKRTYLRTDSNFRKPHFKKWKMIFILCSLNESVTLWRNDINSFTIKDRLLQYCVKISPPKEHQLYHSIGSPVCRPCSQNILSNACLSIPNIKKYFLTVIIKDSYLKFALKNLIVNAKKNQFSA